MNDMRDPREGHDPADSASLASDRWNERGVIDALPGAVVVTDPGGRIVLWSATAERLYGWRPADLEGRPISVLLAKPSEIVAASFDPAVPGRGGYEDG